jgi:predicted transcriptional regulator
MNAFSTRDAAKQLGLTPKTLSRYIAAKKVPAPQIVTTSRTTVHLWTAADIEKVRKILPKIANGRKTRYQRERAKKKSQSQGPKKASKKK